MRLIALLLPAVLWAAQLNGQVPEGPEPVDTVSDAESAADTVEARMSQLRTCRGEPATSPT